MSGIEIYPEITYFDGKSSWEQYKIQFEAVACANNWDAPKKLCLWWYHWRDQREMF